MSRVRTIAQRLLLISLGCLLGLCLVEVGLRISGALLGSERGGRSGVQTVLCVGDSHTYGLHVPPPHSYPARLQALLDPTSVEVGVLNYGVPGRNSGTLLSRLPRYLEQTRPDVVLIKVGFNDSWNFDATDPIEEQASDSLWHGLRDLRVVRMARLLALRGRGRGDGQAADSLAPPELIERDGQMIVVEDGVESRAALGGERFGLVHGKALQDQVARNVEQMVALTRQAGAAAVLLTYSTHNQQVFIDLNQGARSLAGRLGIPLVDLDQAFQEPIAAAGYEALFFHDDHPKAEGNRIIATRVAEFLLDQQLVTGPSGEAIAAELAETTLELIRQDSRGLAFRIQGDPGKEFLLLLSPVAEPSMRYMETALPLGQHPLIGRCLEHPNLRGRLGVNGTTELFLGEDHLEGVGPGALYAVAIVFPPALTETAPPRVSNRISLSR